MACFFANKIVKILGVNFFNGTLTDSLVKAKNSLVVAPSGPGLASDLIKNKFYKESLEIKGVSVS
jgi:hypothetical protein